MSALPDELNVLEDVSARLDAALIPFMLTGSLALNFYAQPRMTRDIDLVVQFPALPAAEIAKLFEPDYYVSTEGIADALAHSTLFNLIHQASVLKVDCIIRKQTPYHLEEFRRRRRIRAGEFETWIASKEDLILSKLRWFADSGSERQMHDIRNLVATGFDEAYVAKWIHELGLTESWTRATAG
jgi:Nucleotidyl transferase AbiEii toxin, Type IV TA system